jgi:membrane-bound ClpP family serine protease
MWSPLFIAATVVIGLLLTGSIMTVVFLSRHHKSATGTLHLIGAIGSVVSPLTPEGTVLIKGELWPACSLSGKLIPHGYVRITGCRAHLLEAESI